MHTRWTDYPVRPRTHARPVGQTHNHCSTGLIITPRGSGRRTALEALEALEVFASVALLENDPEPPGREFWKETPPLSLSAWLFWHLRLEGWLTSEGLVPKSAAASRDGYRTSKYADYDLERSHQDPPASYLVTLNHFFTLYRSDKMRNSCDVQQNLKRRPAGS